ncbi:hypothetical protein GGF46_005459 [Coemansia sp. RSA 552]|nr:hypothetical protein GGF46_005459 [Coemansia sp. RSA 552]
MAQGSGLKKGKRVVTSKRGKSSGSGSSSSSSGAPPLRKGRVVKAAKKQGVVKQVQLQKKLAAKVTTSLEQAMAVKAGAVGKLTIMRDAQKKGKVADVKRRKY